METRTVRQKAARYFLTNEWKRMRGEEIARSGVCTLPAECPALSFLPECLDLLDQYHDTPVRDLAPAIRRLITERIFVDENGDCCAVESLPETINREVEMIVQGLEHLRATGIEPSQWGYHPVTPLMFG